MWAAPEGRPTSYTGLTDPGPRRRGARRSRVAGEHPRPNRRLRGISGPPSFGHGAPRAAVAAAGARGGRGGRVPRESTPPPPDALEEYPARHPGAREPRAPRGGRRGRWI